MIPQQPGRQYKTGCALWRNIYCTAPVRLNCGLGNTHVGTAALGCPDERSSTALDSLPCRNVACLFDLISQGALMLRRTSPLLVLFLTLTPVLHAQVRPDTPDFDVKEHYTKYEYRIAMRDGIHLFTSVYVPKDSSRPYPFLIDRTPYSVGPYGVDLYRTQLGPSPDFDKAGYIFVFQDVRGRYMSEGTFIEMRPHIDNKRSKQDVDDSSDLYETIEWLLKNVPNNNGNAGIWGISYPGFFTSASIIDSHPALKAASPQAPMTDLFKGDDAYHGGAFMLNANFGFYSS